jgi:1,2-diacylglycerol 3-alpha-glucosyltransferase
VDKPLHIAHYTNVYKPMRNGVVTSVESFRRGQLDQGHSVYVVAASPMNKSYQQERFVFNVAAITLWQQQYPFALPYDPTITGVLRGLQPDLLHTHHPMGLGRLARCCSQRLGVPLVFTFHTWYEDFSHYFSKYIPFVSERQFSRFVRYLIRKFLMRCHHVVAPSEYTRSRILDAYGDVLEEKDLSVVPTGIDPKPFARYSKEEARALLGWEPEERFLVSCGRLSKEKNFDVLIEAVSQMKERPKLVILGDGDLKPELRKQLENLGLRDRVELPGNVDRDEVARYFAAADLFTLASPNETQGLVVLEAMAAGTPTVVVGEGGIKDFVKDNVNGVTAKNNPEALARALDLALRSDLSRLSQNARQTASSLNVASQAKRMSDVYAKAMRKQQEQVIRGGLILPFAS